MTNKLRVYNCQEMSIFNLIRERNSQQTHKSNNFYINEKKNTRFHLFIYIYKDIFENSNIAIYLKNQLTTQGKKVYKS